MIESLDPSINLVIQVNDSPESHAILRFFMADPLGFHPVFDSLEGDQEGTEFIPLDAFWGWVMSLDVHQPVPAMLHC